MTIGTRLLAQWQDHDPSRPRLTWYGPESERVELSGRVLANWVVKAANLLGEEADVERDSRVLLDLPVHWRTLVWAAGTWTAGGQVLLPPEPEESEEDDPYGEDEDAYPELDDDYEDDEPEDDEEGEDFVPDAEESDPEVIVTDRPTQDGTSLVLAIALPALATEVTEPMPSSALDASALLPGQADELGILWEPEAGDPALAGGDVVSLRGEKTVSFGDLTEWAAQQSPAAFRRTEAAQAVRTLCSPESVSSLLAHAVTVWLRGGSVIVVDESVTHEQRMRIAETEQATARC